MDINDQLQPIVASLIDSLRVTIEDDLKARVTEEVVKKIANTELDVIVANLVKHQVKDRLDKFKFEDVSKQQLARLVSQLTEQIGKDLTNGANQQITSEINKRLIGLDINLVINEVVKNKLEHLVETKEFPPRSISHRSIDWQGVQLTGNDIKGGIIENFGSTGIEDRATDVRMTIMDHAVAFEKPVFAPSVEIRGNLTVDGSVILNGDIATDSVGFVKLIDHTSENVRAHLNTDLFQSYSDLIFSLINKQGLDLDRITQNGKEVVKGNQLGYHISDSNLQRLGVVNDLQTSGENLLVNTLYVSDKRVGINTISPSAAFSIWDEECEVIIGKRKQDTGYIGSTRAQRVILGTNNKESIILDADGSVEIENLRVGNVPMSSASTIPTYDDITGTIVWNESPSPGSPVGWICLGGARWAKFGEIG